MLGLKRTQPAVKHLFALAGVMILVLFGLIAYQPHTADAAASDRPVAAKVYLLRGFMGVFSTGLDAIAADLKKRGIEARVYGHMQANSVGSEIRKAHAKNKRSVRPLVIVGHSFGANAAMRIAKTLEQNNIRVDLVVTIDPTANGPLSRNVRRYVNYHLGFGTAISSKRISASRIKNIDIRKRSEITKTGTSHWSVTNNKIVSKEIRQLVLRAVR